VPHGSAEFTVGDAFQPCLFLASDEFFDFSIFNVLHVRLADASRQLCRACVFQLLRTKKAANLVGAKWGFLHIAVVNDTVSSAMETTTAANRRGLFITNAGQNVAFTFILVTSLFLLWGFCNGLIDTMDKHFQNELHLTKSQSASVQFAHYLGYFLMSIPAGWLATKLGYKGGIIMGLLMVGLGGLWFIPATHISEMVHGGGVSATTA